MWQSQKGISLLEVLIAILIFGVGVSMALRMLPESSSVTTRSRNMTTAMNFAVERLEELMSMPYNDAALSQGNHSDPLNPIDLHYTRSWVVVDDNPVQGMKRVSVTVRFPTSSADSSVTLNTFITSRR